jgi:uncharacterized membrane protein
MHILGGAVILLSFYYRWTGLLFLNGGILAFIYAITAVYFAATRNLVRAGGFIILGMLKGFFSLHLLLRGHPVLAS